MFQPVRVRLHPVFTQVRDWTGDGRPDGIEVLIELLDQFGDTTKAAGDVRFELHAFREFSPDPRGERIVSPFEGQLMTVEQQRARWSRPSRAYQFQLAWSGIRSETTYVLTTTFETTGGQRLFDQLLIEGRRSATPQEAPIESTPAPNTAHDGPGARSVEP